MSWFCKTCGGKLHIVSTRCFSHTYTIGKDGQPKKRTWKDKYGEHLGNNICCNSCGSFDEGTLIEEVGVWENDRKNGKADGIDGDIISR